MIHSYLFEAKSIQSYLFNSGKLKDIIAASERLDLLIDDNRQSILHQVITSAHLSTDLCETNPQADIHFVRCKGGAFYCYSQTKAPLISLRSVWTLTLQQMFPNLSFVDALVSGGNLQYAIAKGHKQLAADRNTPSITFPMATTITERYQRTGLAQVPLSPIAKRASKQINNEINNVDLDTDLHRQAYQNMNMRDNAALQDKFTPNALKGTFSYPIDLETDFQYSAPNANTRTQKTAIKDMALIHIDGNGLGILLRALQTALAEQNNHEYCLAFRAFSSALTSATQNAAQQATQWLFDNAKYELNGKIYLPMRPLVLGGDDVTLLCRADLALEYSKRFCIAFKQASKKSLASLHRDYKLTEVKPYLTASGGILYHKASHPFTHSHHLVEGLCSLAKTLTKSMDKNTGPAALAFFRLSSAVNNDIEDLIQKSQQFTVQEKQGTNILNLGLNAYLVEDKDNTPTLSQLQSCINSATNQSISMTKWRQMATELALGNKIEADRLYNRAKDLGDKTKVNEQEATMATLAGTNNTLQQWYWQTDNVQLQTVITDLLIVDHFSPVLNEQDTSENNTNKNNTKESI